MTCLFDERQRVRMCFLILSKTDQYGHYAKYALVSARTESERGGSGN